MIIWQYINDFISLFFPEACLGCTRPLVSQEKFICIHCHYNLPYTQFHLDEENIAAKKLWGRVPIENVVSYFYFIYGSPSQQILHTIKYRNKPKAAQFLGRQYGHELLGSGLFKSVGLIVPVPLHKRRQVQRGYNQSYYFGKGLSESMAIRMETFALKRVHHTKSQTMKDRYDRYMNTKNVFNVVQPERLVNQHILLVDDVLTTGATLEACAETLLKVKGVKVSVVTLACTPI